MKALLRKSWLIGLLPLIAACTSDHLEDRMHGYPDEIEEILRASCATAGCHTTQSKEAAAGLDLSTWQALFEGSRGGSPVIPFSPDQSYLLYAVNTDSSRGLTLNPTMPIGAPPLNDAQYQVLRDWITEGAPNHNGALRFPDISSRTKWYVGNQGCDLVAVFDAGSRQIMRYVHVGQVPGLAESPHMIKVSKDKAFWYVIFLAANPYIEKYSTQTDELVKKIYIGNGDWNTFNISPDGKFGFAVAYNSSSVAIVDLERDTLAIPVITFSSKVHGAVVHPNLNRFYLTLQDESALYVLDYDSNGDILNFDNIDLVQNQAPSVPGPLWPHELIFTPDGSKYFVSCQRTKELRVLDAATNTLQDVITVGDDPVEFAIDSERGHLFVTCMEDQSTFASDPSKRGSVYVIDYSTNTVIKAIYPGYQPHGLAIDRASNMLVVANRNVSAGGPAPHHSSACGARNGNLVLIDLNTLELVGGYRPELSVDPYTVAVKH